jgi:hypothetical protein
MSDKRRFDEWNSRRMIQDANWKLDKENKVCFNGGSETNRHFVAKSQVAYFLSQQGYRIDSEVQNQSESAEADIVAYANDEPPFVVEVETGLTAETKERKLEQFYHGTPFVEVYMLEVNELPEDRSDQLEWIQDELGGEL